MTIARSRARQEKTGGAFEAEVVHAPEGAPVEVRRTGGPSALVTSRIAVLGYRPRCGDRVIVLDVEGGAGACIVGVLGATPASDLRDASGASAAIEAGSLVLRDATGALVAAYDPARSTLRIGEGLAQVDIGSPEGKVVLAAREVEIRAGARAAVSAPDLELTSQRASLHSGETSLVATVARVVADEMVHTAGRWEVRVGRLVERAAEVYREAELAETRAERVRTFARAAFDVVAGRATILADDDAVIDGKRVLLG